ncbi:MAG: hypothetical protein ABIA74_04430 [bacterium]
MNKIAIVTDLKVIDSPQAGLGVSRCLKEAGFKIIGIDDTPFITSDMENGVENGDSHHLMIMMVW